MEYRHAVESGKPVIGFLHKNPSKIEAAKTEGSPEGREKLDKFRKLVEQRLCKYYTTPTDLGAKVSRSITQLIKHEPSVGWVRAKFVDEGHLRLLKNAESMNRFGLSRLMTRAELEVSDIAFANAITILKGSSHDREFLIYGKTLEFISRQIYALNEGLSNGVVFKLSVVAPTIHPWDNSFSRSSKTRAAGSISAIRKLLGAPKPDWTGSIELRTTIHLGDNSFSSFIHNGQRVSVLDFDLGDDLSMQCSEVFVNSVGERTFAHHLYTHYKSRFESGQLVLSYPPAIRYAYVYGIKNGKVAMIRKHGRSTWELPGGMIEPGEIPEETAQREFLEETGHEIKLLRSIETREQDKLAFVGKVRNKIGRRDSSEIAELTFFNINNLPVSELLTFPNTGYEEVLSEIERYMI
jgi:8-oxo-dGTP pyrophosphatase MutT (NUDIX family)